MLKTATVTVFLAWLVYQSISWYMFLGLHLHYYNTHPGKCSVVKSAGLGSEDLQVTSDGMAFITSGCMFSLQTPRYRDYMKVKDIKGRVFIYSMSDVTPEAIQLEVKGSETFSLEDFRPHGISVLEDIAKGEHLIYIVNHPFPLADRVEKFRFLPATKELVHLKSFTSQLLRTTNDVAVVKEDVFYLSNYIFSQNKPLSIVEAAFKMTWCNILFYNGVEFQEAVSGLVSPNGITLSKDGSHLYAAMAHELKLRVFKVQTDGALMEVQQVQLHTLPDNLHLSQAGDVIYVGAHPILCQVMAFLEDPHDNIAPSQVLSVPLKEHLLHVDGITEIFYDRGEMITASTVAAVYGDRLIVGSLLDTLVVCDL